MKQHLALRQQVDHERGAPSRRARYRERGAPETMSRRRTILVSLVFFATLFTATASLQYWFIRHKILQTVGQQLDDWADDLSTTLNGGDQLKLADFRHRTPKASAFVVLASDGTVIDTRGFVEGSIVYATLPAGLVLDHPVRVKSALGEEWY